jgi:uncharacterized protein (TIGR02452 family)
MNRQARSKMAEETLSILNCGQYVDPLGKLVDLSTPLRESVRTTRLIRPQDWDSIIDEARGAYRAGAIAKIEVTGEATLGALRRLVVDEGRIDVAGLNFASAKNPGGGFLGGSQAQEESLARSSGLYASLKAAPEYYAANRKSRSKLYTDHAILSTRVPVFRDDGGSLLGQPYMASFITMPAVNAGAIKDGSPERSRVAGVMERRIHCVLALAASTGHRTVVLGAWGCGVFRNDPEIIASLFARALGADAKWRSCFERIVFAVFSPNPDDSTRQIFERHLNMLPPY